MICPKCGQQSPEDSRFCEHCGAPLGETPPNTESRQHAHHHVSPGVLMGREGILRWVYEMNMWKNPTLVITIWKVLLLAALAPALLIFFLTLEDGIGSAFLAFFQIMAIVAAVVSGLMLLAYPLVAVLNGGKYCVMFEMDDTCVKHIQMQNQFNKNQVLALVVTLAGAMAGNMQAAGAGMLAGSKQSAVSRFENVRSITVNEMRHVIYVDDKVTHNQVYADSADFAFVRDAIISRCKKAKVTYK